MKRKEKVNKVYDGDTFKTKQRQRPVRLAGIDTPEKGEPGYIKAKKALENLILGEEVTIDTQARDKYRRAVAKVKKGNKSINEAMKKYSK